VQIPAHLRARRLAAWLRRLSRHPPSRYAMPPPCLSQFTTSRPFGDDQLFLLLLAPSGDLAVTFFSSLGGVFMSLLGAGEQKGQIEAIFAEITRSTGEFAK